MQLNGNYININSVMDSMEDAMTLHDEIKKYEKMGIPEDVFKDTLWHQQALIEKYFRHLKRAFKIEFFHPILRKLNKILRKRM